MKKSIYSVRFTHRPLLFIMGMFISLATFAQQIAVKGNVKDAVGEPVIGASVVQVNTTNGTITDFNGNFSIIVPSGSFLSISYIGYSSQKVQVNKRNSYLNIVLKEDSKLLDEVVVVGYGTMRKKDLTGSVSSVRNKDFQNSPVTNIGQAMQGKLSGVNIIDTGTPGDNVTIKVRGLGTINDSNPLIVIDGIPTDLGLSSLNMNDIESVDVLKDASATAIYGSRGANGVVMITSKRGKEGKGIVTISGNWAVQNATSVPDLLNASQYAQLSNEMLTAVGSNVNPDWQNPLSLVNSTDWLDRMLRTGIKQDYTLSYSGGNDKNKFYVSGGFMNQKGIISEMEYRRFNFQVNLDSQIKSWLKFITSVKFNADNKDYGDYSVGDAMKALPTQAMYNDNGTWAGPVGNSEWYGSIRNPIGTLYVNNNNNKNYDLLANITGELSFNKWLKFRSTFGYDAKFWFYDKFTPKYDWDPSPTAISSRFKSDNKSFTYLWDNYFMLNTTINEKHHIDMMAGSSAQWCDFDYMNAQMNDFLFDNIHEMDNGKDKYSLGGSTSSWSLLSLMGRLNYNYNNKYFITGTLRYDGSSRFGKNNRWGLFPSASGAWRISEERFFPKDALKINDLKLRIGYGVTGNQNIGNYGFVASYDTNVYPFNGVSNTALVSNTLSNPNIHWEEVRQSNIGFDLSMFDSRLNFSADAYIKDTHDMLVKATIPITSGFEDTSTTYTNAGKVSNKGIEMTLNTINSNGAFLWETTMTATYNKNKIKDLNSETPMYINQINNSYLTVLKKDYPINVFYGYVTDGIFQNKQEVNDHAIQVGAEPGDIRFKDLNNDGVINDDDRTVIGNPNPTWLLSMNNRFGYKGFELSVFIQGVTGNKIYNANNIDNEGMAAAYNQTTKVLDRWSGEGTSNSVPRAVWGDPNGNNRVSNRFVENGSYLRIKNITLSYNLPKTWLGKMQFMDAKLYLSCENVATITDYSGFDPEVDINGIDCNRYPISRTFSLGVNFNF